MKFQVFRKDGRALIVLVQNYMTPVLSVGAHFQATGENIADCRDLWTFECSSSSLDVVCQPQDDTFYFTALPLIRQKLLIRMMAEKPTERMQAAFDTKLSYLCVQQDDIVFQGLIKHSDSCLAPVLCDYLTKLMEAQEHADIKPVKEMMFIYPLGMGASEIPKGRFVLGDLQDTSLKMHIANELIKYI